MLLSNVVSEMVIVTAPLEPSAKMAPPYKADVPPREIETSNTQSTEDWSQSFHSLTYTAELLLNVVSLMIREPEEMWMAPPY